MLWYKVIMEQNKRVVVTGMGVVAPNAIGLDNFEDALRNSKSGIRFIPELEELKFGCQVGGIPPNIDGVLNDYFIQEELLGMSEGMIYTGIAAIDAYKDAGLQVPAYNSGEVNWDTGAMVGTGLGSIDVIAKTIIPQVDSGRVARMGSTVVEKTMCSSISAKLAGIFALGNNVTTNSSACTTGAEAIIYSYHRIKSGQAEKMLAGGTEIGSPYLWSGFDSMRVLNKNFNDSPDKASRPMSQTADGFIPSAGSGILFLESLRSAEKRGACIYTEILGGTLNCGGHRLGGSMTAPNPVAVQKNIKDCVKMAEISPQEIDYINGHLTATFADPIEINNWSTALDLVGNRFPYINSTKSLIGHGLAAAGSMECVATILQLHKGFLHKSLNCEDLHEKIKPFEEKVVRKTVNKDINIAMKSSFGFGDVNGSLIFKKWSED